MVISEGRMRQALDERAELAPDMNRVLDGMRVKAKTAKRRRRTAGVAMVTAAICVLGTGWFANRPEPVEPLKAKPPGLGYSPTWLPDGLREASRSRDERSFTRTWIPGGFAGGGSWDQVSFTVTENGRDHSSSTANPDMEFTETKVGGRPARQESDLWRCALRWQSVYGDELALDVQGPKETRCRNLHRIAESVQRDDTVKMGDSLTLESMPTGLEVESRYEARTGGECLARLEIGDGLPWYRLELRDTPMPPGGEPMKVGGREASFFSGPRLQYWTLDNLMDAALTVKLENRLWLSVSASAEVSMVKGKPVRKPVKVGPLVEFAENVKVNGPPECAWV